MEGWRLCASDIVENTWIEHCDSLRIEQEIHGLVLKADIHRGTGIGNLQPRHIDLQWIVLLTSAPLLQLQDDSIVQRLREVPEKNRKQAEAVVMEANYSKYE